MVQQQRLGEIAGDLEVRVVHEVGNEVGVLGKHFAERDAPVGRRQESLLVDRIQDRGEQAVRDEGTDDFRVLLGLAVLDDPDQHGAFEALGIQPIGELGGDEFAAVVLDEEVHALGGELAAGVAEEFDDDFLPLGVARVDFLDVGKETLEVGWALRDFSGDGVQLVLWNRTE